MTENIISVLAGVTAFIGALTPLVVAVTALWWCYIQQKQLWRNDRRLHRLENGHAEQPPAAPPAPAPGPVIPRPATGQQPPERV